MLVLSRKQNESIIIGDNTIITVVEVRNNRVRLGIETSPDTTVHRKEIYDAVIGRKEPFQTVLANTLTTGEKT